jgi:hypothetical protein
MLKQLRNDIEIWRAYQLARKSRKLHMAPPVIAEFEYSISDIETKKVNKKYKQLSHSFTRNYLNFVALTALAYPHDTNIIGTAYDTGSLALKNTSGTMYSRSAVVCPVWNVVSTSAGNVTNALRTDFASADDGIQFGTDNTPETLNDFTLVNKLTPSLITQRGALIYNSTTKVFSVDYTKLYPNTTGDTIEVGEVCLIGLISLPSSTNRCMLIRDTFPTKIQLLNNKQLTFTYRLSYLINE